MQTDARRRAGAGRAFRAAACALAELVAEPADVARTSARADVIDDASGNARSLGRQRRALARDRTPRADHDLGADHGPLVEVQPAPSAAPDAPTHAARALHDRARSARASPSSASASTELPAPTTHAGADRRAHDVAGRPSDASRRGRSQPASIERAPGVARGSCERWPREQVVVRREVARRRADVDQ